MPLAAVVVDKKGTNKIFCCHGGIGSNFVKMDELNSLKRPLKISFEQQSEDNQKVIDLLWNDLVVSEEEKGIVPNMMRDPNNQQSFVKRFGHDIVDKFLKTNGISMIVRSHENPERGEDREGQVMTISSTSNYCGTQGNAAGFIVIQKKMLLSFKIIKPLPVS
jgi:hypothetical protein